MAKEEEDFKKEIKELKGSTQKMKDIIDGFTIKSNILSDIWDSIPVAMFFKDDKNTLIKVNKKLCEISGMKKEDMEMKTVEELNVAGSIALQYAINDDSVLRTGKPKIGIIEKLFNTNILLRTDKIPVFDSNGKVAGVLGISIILER